MQVMGQVDKETIEVREIRQVVAGEEAIAKAKASEVRVITQIVIKRTG